MEQWKQILVVNLLYFKMHSIRLRFLLPLFFHCEFLNELLDYFVKKCGKYIKKIIWLLDVLMILLGLVVIAHNLDKFQHFRIIELTVFDTFEQNFRHSKFNTTEWDIDWEFDEGAQQSQSALSENKVKGYCSLH